MDGTASAQCPPLAPQQQSEATPIPRISHKELQHTRLRCVHMHADAAQPHYTRSSHTASEQATCLRGLCRRGHQRRRSPRAHFSRA